MTPTVVVRGSGDVGSAVAHLLFSEGYRVIVHDEPSPAAPRRGMAFTDALFDGSVTLEGVEARLIEDPARSTDGFVAIVTDPDLPAVLARARAGILVDARMRKRATPEPQLHLAPLTVALGPNCEAGVTAHVVIETQWGDRLGAVLRHGRTRKLGGEPRTYGGHARDRFVYAPVAGRFATDCSIADRVQKGDVVASIGKVELHAPLDGILRGLVRHGVTVVERSKVVEVDPRADRSKVIGIGERPGRIALGVLEAIAPEFPAGSI